MKKHILTGMALAMLIQTAGACGICGCPSSGTYLGVLPQYQKNFIGLRYNYRSFQTTHPTSIIPGLSGRKSQEQFQALEIMGRYVPGKRWQIIGILPYQQLQQTILNNRSGTAGFGDVSIISYFSVIPGKPNANQKMIHLLQFGTGLKLPTGKNIHTDESAEYNPQFQLGSGSLDGILSAIYTIRGQKAGWMTDANLQLNGTNRYGYQFGTKYAGTTRYFYTLKNCKGTWMFHTGIYGEFANGDHLNNIYQNNTGGALAMPVGGVDFYGKRFAFGVNGRIPAWQNLSDGYVKSNARLLLSVIYLLN